MVFIPSLLESSPPDDEVGDHDEDDHGGQHAAHHDRNRVARVSWSLERGEIINCLDIYI